MRCALLGLVSALAITASTAALAADGSPVPVPVQTVSDRPTDDPNRVICHHIIHEGDLLPAVRCNTERGWERTRRATQKFISDYQTRSLVMRVR